VLESLMRAPAGHLQRGLTLVELLVGTALGLVVVAGAMTLLAGQIANSRRMLLEARLQQDLRAAADLLARDMRRAGYWQHAVEAIAYPPRPNPYRALTPSATTSATSATYSYSRDITENDAVDSNERFGVRVSSRALQLLDGGGGWQQVTDPASVHVTRLVIQPVVRRVALGHRCSPPCDASEPACPSLHLRTLDIDIQGRSPTDNQVVRRVRQTVRLRNDDLPAAQCPA
jgi:prepilin peptidase dependent protein B